MRRHETLKRTISLPCRQTDVWMERQERSHPRQALRTYRNHESKGSTTSHTIGQATSQQVKPRFNRRGFSFADFRWNISRYSNMWICGIVKGRGRHGMNGRNRVGVNSHSVKLPIAHRCRAILPAHLPLPANQNDSSGILAQSSCKPFASIGIGSTIF